MRNYEGKKERRKRKIYSISGINFYLSKGKEKKERGVKKNVWEIAINFWKPRLSKVITKTLRGICDFARLPSNCQPPTFWVSAYLTACPECVHTYTRISPRPRFSSPFFIHCFLAPEAACFWCFRAKIFASMLHRPNNVYTTCIIFALYTSGIFGRFDFRARSKGWWVEKNLFIF